MRRSGPKKLIKKIAVGYCLLLQQPPNSLLVALQARVRAEGLEIKGPQRNRTHNLEPPWSTSPLTFSSSRSLNLPRTYFSALKVNIPTGFLGFFLHSYIPSSLFFFFLDMLFWSNACIHTHTNIWFVLNFLFNSVLGQLIDPLHTMSFSCWIC